MKLTVLIPTKCGYYREKSLSYTIQSYLRQSRYSCNLGILVVIDGKRCRNIERIDTLVRRFNTQGKVRVETIVYYGYNPVWGGIRYLSNSTDYILVQGDDELAARTKIVFLEKIIRRYSDSVIQLPVFERTTEPRYLPKSMIGQVNRYGITSNFDAFPLHASEPFEIHNLASNRVMPIGIASRYNLEHIRLWGGYGVETFLAFLLSRDGVKMYYIPRKEVANLHLQAERPFWSGYLCETNFFATREELEKMILDVSLGFHKNKRELFRKTLGRLANFTYIAWIFNEIELVHRVLKSFVEGIL